MPDVLWSRTFEGRQPRIVLGEDRVLLDYTYGVEGEVSDAQPRELVCLDFQGLELWRRPDCSGLLPLPRNRFLVVDACGMPEILDGDGRAITRWTGKGGINQAAWYDDLLALRTDAAVYVTDLGLQPINKLEWPEGSRPTIDCFVDGAFRWVKDDELWMLRVFGEPEPFAPLPSELVESVLSSYEKQTGSPAVPGGRVTLPTNGEDLGPYIRGERGDWTFFGVGDRPYPFQWQLGFDEEARLFFLANCMIPHLMLCLDAQGNAKWCRYLLPSCCGGVPQRLPSGLYVASSGCGGMLTWFDGHGHVLFQSDPAPPNTGLAYAYRNVGTVLSDGRFLIDGGQGVDAFSSSGERLWRAKLRYGQFEVCEKAGLLFGCGWARGRGEEQPPAVVLQAVGDL